jgi:Zn-dependent M28 family amino/carboxypeptidase
MSPRHLVLFFSVIALVACSRQDESASHVEALGLPPEALQAAEVIDTKLLENVVAHLADDALAGRAPATPGDRMTREYLAETLRRIGFQPGGPQGAWVQPLDLVGIRSQMPATWRFRGPAGAQLDLAWLDDYTATSGLQQEAVAIDDAELVFVGYGIVAPEEGWDDFKGSDLRGKILLMLNSDPDWDPALFGGERRMYYGRWTYKYESAARQGAAGAILVHTTPSAGYPYQVVQSSWTGEQFELPAGDEPRVAVTGWVTEDAARKLVALGGSDLDALVQAARTREFRPVPLGVRTSLHFTNELNRGARTANVLGLLLGSDPDLYDELVVYTAHHDHLGVGKPDAEGDAIHNGARDNAAGVATVLGVARAFTALPRPPRRSVLVMLVAAEEQGLLGSRWFAEHPMAPAGKIVANINVDGPNVFGRTRDVAVIGRGKSSLEDLLETAAKIQGRVLVDEPSPDQGYYYRSDQYNFAKIGVPALYFKGGTDYIGRDPAWGREIEDRWRATRYHQPSDEVYEEWNLEGLVEDARLAFWVGLAAAQAPDPPAWRPGDEFEAVRQRALAAVAGR